MRTLRQCLFDYELALLRAIAEQWGVDLPSNRHDDAVDILTARLSDPAAQAEAWLALPEAERGALAVLAQAGGSLPSGTFTRHFGDIRPMGPGRVERERPWETPLGAAESLWYRGMIFKAFDEGPGGMQEVIFVPRELEAMIQANEMSRASSGLPSVSAPQVQKQAGAQLADDLCSFLAYIHAHPINASSVQSLPDHHRKALTLQLRHQDPIRLDLLAQLATQLSLVKPDAIPFRPDPHTATAWLQSPTLLQQRSLFEGWRDTTAWNDLWHVPSLRCEDTGSWRNDPLAARRVVLDTLAKLEPGAWYRVDDWLASIREASPDFQRPGGDYDIWYIRDAATNQYLRGFASWDQVEGALLRFILGGPLQWLGAIGIDADNATFSITEVGHWLVKACAGETPQWSEDSSFAVRADGQVHVSASRRYDRFQVARVADWVASSETYTYRVTPSSLERAKTQRITPERIVEFLERASGAPLPESLAGALRRWGTRGTEAWAQPAIVLRVARPELLEKLTESPRTRKFIRETVSSTVALVSPHDWPEMHAALLEMGVLPEVTTERGI